MIELRAENLKKVYGSRTVVSKVDVRVRKGEVVGLLGPNGAGKTTSFYMIVGLVRPSLGKIYLGDKDITELALNERVHEGIGYLPQEACVFRELTVEENILAALELQAIYMNEKKNRLETLIKDFGLGHIRKSKGKSLSGGERRRVEIARCLATNPEFILLDEPFAGVDPLAVGDIQLIVKKLKNKKIGVLITDHSVRETLGIVDRAYIMSSGELLVSGTPDEIINSEVARKFYLGDEFRM